MLNPHHYCELKTRKSSTNFAYAFLLLTKTQKQALNAVYAFCREVDDIVDDELDKTIAKEKLKVWRQEINSLYADGKVEHPITLALQELLPRFNLPQQAFLDLISGMEMDLNDCNYKTIKDLRKYCFCAAGTVGLLIVEVLGYQNKSTREYAKDLGICLQLINIIRDVKEDLARGRIYLPEEELGRYGLVKTTIEYNNSFYKLLTKMATYAREHYEKALSHLSKEDRVKQKPGLVMAEIYLKLLDKMENENFNVLESRIRLSLWQKCMAVFNVYLKY